jgi:2-C-methyl-D-erythritol 4-phosphate cytidylyltransferase/2-C-methyl-D-erythritol 2,4-cyclodiphosphate synthase
LSEVYALIPAAGRGARFGSSDNKVFAPLLGRPLLGWTIQAFANCDAIHKIVLIGSASDLPRLREIGTQYGGGKLHTVVEGGADRQSSVRLGLAACSQAEYIVVHDGARPCVTPELITASIDAVRESDAVTVALPLTDTLNRFSINSSDHLYVEEPIQRDNTCAIQTPQAFRTTFLQQAHDSALGNNLTVTDDASVIRAIGGQVRIVPGSPENLKVTRPGDIALAEAILLRRHTPPPFPCCASATDLPSEGEGAFASEEIRASPKPEADVSPSDPVSAEDKITPVQNAPSPSEGRSVALAQQGKGGGVPLPFRIGYGYDVHPFADGRPMYLGGVHFPEADRGLLGHSDADALLHAVCDALLGAAGLGDIGKHFPPSDNRHKDRRSTEFLREVGQSIHTAGWQVGNMDVMVLAETPRVGPRVEEIRITIAEILGISPEQISIKATTNEGMGFVGRGEGIAVHATALLMALR